MINGVIRIATSTKKKMGRPSKFDGCKDTIIRLSKLGMTDALISQSVGITEATLTGWKKKYPDFFMSLKDAKSEYDENVETALYNRALGFQTTEQKAMVVDGKIEIVDVDKTYPPDATSMIFWLKNRQPEKWRDKREIEHTGQQNTFAELSDQELLKEIERRKQLLIESVTYEIE